MFNEEDFISERNAKANNNFQSEEFKSASGQFHDISRKYDYQYMFESFGLPIIQDPQDIIMLQEVIWKYQPDFVVEAGVARGGSLILSASVLALLNFCDLTQERNSRVRGVIGIDIKFHDLNKKSILEHPFASLVTLIEGSSVDLAVFKQIKEKLPNDAKVMVILDSNHTHEHVLGELNLYSSLVTPGMPLLVMDTGIEFAEPSTLNQGRSWRKGDNPYTATKKFLESDIGKEFKISREIETRHLITCAPEGLLIRS